MSLSPLDYLPCDSYDSSRLVQAKDPPLHNHGFFVLSDECSLFTVHVRREIAHT